MRESYDATWRISSESADAGGHCVEVGLINDGSGRIVLRHSFKPEEKQIVYTREEWIGFLNGVRNGEFDFH